MLPTVPSSNPQAALINGISAVHDVLRNTQILLTEVVTSQRANAVTAVAPAAASNEPITDEQQGELPSLNTAMSNQHGGIAMDGATRKARPVVATPVVVRPLIKGVVTITPAPATATPAKK